MIDLLSGNPYKRISAFCVPLLIGNLFQQLYSMADSMIVGRLMGANAFGAVGSTGSLSFLIMGFVMGLCSGFAIPLAQDFGAQDKAGMRKCVANCLWLCAVITLILSIVTYFYTDDLLRMLNTPKELFDDAYGYIHVIFVGMGATVLYNMLACILRAVGDSKTPLYFLIIACVLNIALDLLFIAVFKLGVAGAGYATIISQFVSGVMCLFAMRKRFPELMLKKPDLRLNTEYTVRLLKNGVPMGLQFSITAIGSVTLQSAVNGLGATAVTAMSAGSRVSNLLACPMESLGIAMATFTGQNLGAQKIDRIKKGVWQMMAIGLVYCAMAFGICLLFSRPLTELFIGAAELTVLELTEQYLLYNSIFFPALLVIYVFRNTVQGLGFSKEAMLAGVFEMVARVVVAFGFVKTYGFVAASLANPAAWVAATLLLLWLYHLKISRLWRWEQARRRAEKMREALDIK